MTKKQEPLAQDTNPVLDQIKATLSDEQMGMAHQIHGILSQYLDKDKLQISKRDVYSEILKTVGDIDIATVEKVQDIRSLTSLVLPIVMASAVYEQMKTDSEETSSVEVIVPAAGRDSFGVVFTRKVDSMGKDESGDSVVKSTTWGSVKSSYSAVSTLPSRSLLEVRKALHAQAKELFGS